MDEVPQTAARLVPTQAQPRPVRGDLETAEQILLEKGADAFKMSDIVARAGVPHGSLYQYFPTRRRDCHAGVAGKRRRSGLRWRGTGDFGPDDVADALRRVTDGYYAMFRDLPVMQAIWQATQADPALQKAGCRCIALAGLLQSRLAQVLTAPAEALDTFARLQITLIGAVVREAITLPPPQAQSTCWRSSSAAFVMPDFG